MKDRKYYRFMGYSDGSGRPYGYIIKYYTQEEYDYYTKRCGHILIKLPFKED